MPALGGSRTDGALRGQLHETWQRPRKRAFAGYLFWEYALIEMYAREAEVDYRIPPEPYLSRVVREGVAGFVRSHGVAEEDVVLLLIALGEALANAIEHARAQGPIHVSVRVSHDRVVATVRDSGIGFAGAFPIGEPVLPHAECERGRGFPLMRRCSDIFTVKSSPGKGTAVVLGRYLRKTREAAAVA